MIVYSALNLVNGKRYVGVTITSLRHRIGQHLSSKHPFGCALRKYGRNSFRIEEIDNAKTRSELWDKERHWIAYFACMFPRGYNLTAGGDGVREVTPETRRKMSLSKTGHPRPDIKPEDLTGRRFGRLLVQSLVSTKPARWRCKCDCGNLHDVFSTALKAGKNRSCGCLRSEVTSARTRKYEGGPAQQHPLYSTWIWLRRKKEFMCSDWTESFQKFTDDMGERPKGKMLCRRHLENKYGPDNCYWGTKLEHARYSAILLEFKGKVQTQTRWARELRIRASRIAASRANGIPFERFVRSLYAA